MADFVQGKEVLIKGRIVQVAPKKSGGVELGIQTADGDHFWTDASNAIWPHSDGDSLGDGKTTLAEAELTDAVDRLSQVSPENVLSKGIAEEPNTSTEVITEK